MDYESSSDISFGSDQDDRSSLRGSPTLQRSSTLTSYSRLFQHLAYKTLPFIILYLTLFLIKNIAIFYFRDHKDITLASTIGVGFSIINILSIFPLTALNNGFTAGILSNFKVQNFRSAGILIHKTILIKLLLMIPCAVVLFFSDKLCLLLGFESQLLSHLRIFVPYCLPGLFLFMISSTLTCYLNVFNIILAPTIIQIIATGTFWAISLILVCHFEWGVEGIALSFNIMQAVSLLFLWLFLVLDDPVPNTFFCFCKDSIEGLWTCFKSYFDAGFVWYFEVIVPEIIYLLAATLRDEDLAGLTIAYIFLSLVNVVPVALGDAVYCHVKKSMEENHINKSKRYLKMGLIIMAIYLVIAEALYYAFAKEIAGFYTMNSNVLETTVNVMMLTLILLPATSIQTILSKGLRSIRKDRMGVFWTLFCHYVIALPLAICLCFETKIKVYGIVIGYIVAMYLEALGLLAMYKKIAWREPQVMSERLIKSTVRI